MYSEYCTYQLNYPKTLSFRLKKIAYDLMSDFDDSKIFCVTKQCMNTTLFSPPKTELWQLFLTTVWTQPNWLMWLPLQASLGGRVRLMITGAAPVSPTVLTFLRAALGCQVHKQRLLFLCCQFPHLILKSLFLCDDYVVVLWGLWADRVYCRLHNVTSWRLVSW